MSNDALNGETTAHTTRIPGPLERMCWLHASKRTDPAMVVAVILRGIAPPPAALGARIGTAQLELALQLQTSVYAYLGRTIESFGTFAVAMRIEAAFSDGVDVSPFDTGGLVNRTIPVSSWLPEEKRRFLGSYSWRGVDLPGRLHAYPGTAQAAVDAYVAAKRPSHVGPHEIWPSEMRADIWAPPNEDWRAWTWEGRWQTQIPAKDYLFAWSCTPAVMDDVVEYVESDAFDGTESDLALFWSRRVVGGISKLMEHCDKQVKL